MNKSICLHLYTICILVGKEVESGFVSSLLVWCKVV